MQDKTWGKIGKSSVIGYLWYKDDVSTWTAAGMLFGVWADEPSNALLGAAMRSPVAAPITLAAFIATPEGQEAIEEFIVEDYQPFVQDRILGDSSPHRLPPTYGPKDVLYDLKMSWRKMKPNFRKFFFSGRSPYSY